jgi:hypothetical protein
MFKVIESDEEFEAALCSGLLWLGVSVELPRTKGWCPAHKTPDSASFIRKQWKERFDYPGDALKYQPEDFTVLVEDD